MNPADPQLLSVKCIWDRASHNAFTDLLWYHDRWLCTFRESMTHGNREDGTILLIQSVDAMTWSPLATFRLPRVDLRDPKLSIMPDGRLMLLVGYTARDDRDIPLPFETAVTFSQDGHTWTPLQTVLQKGEWLWRVTWDSHMGYGIAYGYSDFQDRMQPWFVRLYQTSDGMMYQLVAQLEVPGYPSEATIRFSSEGQMVALIRREGLGDGGAWLGRSWPPFIDWNWQPLDRHLDGPDFVIDRGETIWAAGRTDESGMTALCRIREELCERVLVLPSGGDNSYPGLVLRDQRLYMSYYSSHENKTAIYLAQIELDPIAPVRA